MQQKAIIYLNTEQGEYLRGEKRGRQDGAKHYGQADTRWMSEYEAAGYRDGYFSTFHL